MKTVEFQYDLFDRVSVPVGDAGPGRTFGDVIGLRLTAADEKEVRVASDRGVIWWPERLCLPA